MTVMNWAQNVLRRLSYDFKNPWIESPGGDWVNDQKLVLRREFLYSQFEQMSRREILTCMSCFATTYPKAVEPLFGLVWFKMVFTHMKTKTFRVVTQLHQPACHEDRQYMDTQKKCKYEEYVRNVRTYRQVMMLALAYAGKKDPRAFFKERIAMLQSFKVGNRDLQLEEHAFRLSQGSMPEWIDECDVGSVRVEFCSACGYYFFTVAKHEKYCTYCTCNDSCLDMFAYENSFPDVFRSLGSGTCVGANGKESAALAADPVCCS